MAEFLVKLADERGRLAQQVEQGYSESEVRERFVQQGYLVYWVKPRGLFVGGKLQIRGRKVKQSQFVIFNQQFLTLTKAGLPILNSLDLLIRKQKDKNLQSLLRPSTFSPRFTPPRCWRAKRVATWKRCSVAISPSSGWR